MSLDPSRSLPPLKSFALTHILYDPTSHLSIPFTLLSLSPIFLFVAYFTLIVFNRNLTVALLATGSVGNEVLSLLLKRWWKGDRPWKGHGEVGVGHGMPSSHSQAAGFLLAWGIGHALSDQARQAAGGPKSAHKVQVPALGGQSSMIRRIRTGIYLFGLALWSVLVAYSRWHLHYHAAYQVIAGYSIGIMAGSAHFILTEYIPLHYPASPLGRIRRGIEWTWVGLGGVGGRALGGGAPGGWGEGHFFLDRSRQTADKVQ